MTRGTMVYKVLLVTVLLSFWGMTAAFAAMVTATGQGGSERTALNDAKRQAVEQQVGTYVDSRTYVENYQVIHDRIYTQTEGYIKDYRIINKNYFNGIWTVEIQADISDAKLRADVMSRLQKRRSSAPTCRIPASGYWR